MLRRLSSLLTNRVCHTLGTVAMHTLRMRICGVCHQEKPDEAYNFRNKALAKRHSVCKVCKRTYSMRYYRKNSATYSCSRKVRVYKYRIRNRLAVADYLASHPCVDCRESDPLVLEFDHVVGRKLKAVSTLIMEGSALPVLVEEIAKCVVRCANCHRRRTASSRGYWKTKKQGISLLMKDFSAAW